jgi:hypothetical protein
MLRSILSIVIACLLTAAFANQTAYAQEQSQPFGLATYYECEIAEEARADTLVTEVMAPVFDRFLSEGKILSWGWNAHVLGGSWRRLFYIYATNMNTLISARSEILGELSEQDAASIAEFNEICDSHDDYVWRTLVARP